MGGFKGKEAVQIALTIIPFWMMVTAAALSALSVPVPVGLLTVATTLGTASRALVYLSLGIVWQLSPTPRVALDAMRALAVRYAVGGLTAAGVALVLAAGPALGPLLAHPSVRTALVALGTLALAPVGLHAKANAARFRHNPEPVQTATAASQALSVVFMMLYCGTAGTLAREGVVAHVAALPLALAAALAAGALSVGAFVWLQRNWGAGNRVRMVYEAGEGGAGAAAAAAGGGASAAVAGPPRQMGGSGASVVVMPQVFRCRSALQVGVGPLAAPLARGGLAAPPGPGPRRRPGAAGATGAPRAAARGMGLAAR